MYSTIVVPVDGSPFSERALPTAIALARRSLAALELVHVAIPPVRASGVPMLDARFDAEQGRELEAHIAELGDRIAHDSGLTVRVVPLRGAPADAVATYLDGSGSTLVVMTTHGRGGLKRAWLGSVADDLVRRATVPLLLIRPDADETLLTGEPLFQRVLVPLDRGPDADDALTHAAALGTPEVTQYLLLAVIAPPETAGPVPDLAVLMQRSDLAGNLEGVCAEAEAHLSRVASQFSELGARVTIHTVLDGQPDHAILEFAREQSVDLIVLSTHVGSVGKRLLIGSITDRVLRHSHSPVLVCGPHIDAAVGKQYTEGDAGPSSTGALSG